MRLSIQPSSVGMDAGSEAGESRLGSGNLPTSTSIFESILTGHREFIVKVVCSSRKVKVTGQFDSSAAFFSSKTILHLLF